MRTLLYPLLWSAALLAAGKAASAEPVEGSECIRCEAPAAAPARHTADVREVPPILPAPKIAVPGIGRQPRRFAALRFDPSGDPAPFAAVVGELEALADPAAGGQFVIRLSRSRREMKALLDRHAPAAPADAASRECYTLELAGDTARIVAPAEAGGRHALQTLKQLLRSGYDRDLTVVDWCDLPQRIFMDDISRGAVPTMEQAKRQIRDLAELKYNGAMFYIEHVVRSELHPDFAPADGCFTLGEVREIARYAASYGIELIGSFQSFGHFEQILAHDRYRDLGDTESMISTTDPRARRFLEEVIGELCEAFPSDRFNVNCDETWDLGAGGSRERVEAVGKERFYAEHILFLREVLRKHGKQLMMWSDMVLKHPGILALLPPDVILLTWNYDARESYAAWLEPLRGRRFLVCPGVHSSGRMMPDMRAAEGNLSFIGEGQKAGAEGAVLTSWDEGALHSCHHLCYGIARAAEAMWDTARTTADPTFRDRYERIRFGAPNGALACIDDLMELGGLAMFNGMNDRIFYQRFAPQPGRPLTIDLRQLRQADSIVRSCGEALDNCRAARNRTEIEAWRHAIDSYRFVVEARLRMARIAALYAAGTRDSLVTALAHCDTLQLQAERLKSRFSALWFYENRYHSHDRGMRAYAEKRNEIDRVRTTLEQALRRTDSGLAPLPASEAGLEVIDRQNAYMCFWLTAGPFDDEAAEEVPAEAAAAEPTPGGRFTIGGREYKWTKSESLNGLTMDGNACCASNGRASLYAYARLTSPCERDIDLLVGYAGKLRLYNNGVCLYDGAIETAYAPDRRRIRIRLRAGENRMLIRLQQEVPEWLFSCIVEGAAVHARKHKYVIE